MKKVLFLNKRSSQNIMDCFDLFVERAKEDETINLDELRFQDISELQSIDKKYDLAVVPILEGILPFVQQYHQGKIIAYGAIKDHSDYDGFIYCPALMNGPETFSREFLKEIKQYL